MNQYYIYTHTRNGETLPFYVGKGFGRRAYSLKARSKFWKRVAKYGYTIQIEIPNLSEDEAFQLESEIIKTYGRRDLGTGCLVNLTDGGEGASGYIHSEETCAKIGRAQKGKTLSEETRKKVAEARKGKTRAPFSDDHKRKISEAKKGKPRSDEHKRKLSESLKGKPKPPRSDDHRRKISEARKINNAKRKLLKETVV